VKALVSGLLERRTFPPLVASGRLRGPVRVIVAVIDGPNPSYDYYLAPRLARLGIPARVLDLSARPPDLSATEFAGALVLFCRYMSGSWLRAVAANRAYLSGTALFLDDDLDALFADASVPLRYRFHLYRRALAHRRRLGAVLDLLYASNPAIAARHGAANTRLLSPLASEADEPSAAPASDRFRIAFHATYVHWREHEWLMPVAAAVTRANPQVVFEVIANPQLAARWRAVQGVRVLPSMPWPGYRAWTRSESADLLLAPLLKSPANAARSGAKRIDALRLGAALLVSEPGIYRCSGEEIGLGMSVPADAEGWSGAILALAREPERVKRLRDLNAEHMRQAGLAAEPLLTDDEIAR
jgi:hypothetical protein